MFILLKQRPRKTFCNLWFDVPKESPCTCCMMHRVNSFKSPFYFPRWNFGIQAPSNADVLKDPFFSISSSSLSFLPPSLPCSLPPSCPPRLPSFPLLSNLICSQFVDAVYCDRPPSPPTFLTFTHTNSRPFSKRPTSWQSPPFPHPSLPWSHPL